MYGTSFTPRASVACPYCESKKVLNLLCERCDGTGFILVGRHEFNCETCDGGGQASGEYECQDCGMWFDDSEL